MARELNSEVVHNPSDDFTQWPEDHGQRPLDLSVVLSVGADDRVEMIALPNGKRAPRTRVHRANLHVSGTAIRHQADRLRGRWQDFVRHQPLEADGMPSGPLFPFAATHDLRSLRSTVVPVIEELAEVGAYTLNRILAGTDSDLVRFREFLLGELRLEGLRISFDSDLSLPWPMFAVRTEDSATPSFLGHRHEIEQTGASYAPFHSPAVRPLPVTSLNTDLALDGVGRSQEVAELLGERSTLTVRTHADDLLKSLSDAEFDEDLMYFWCHGAFEEYGVHRTVGVRLSDNKVIDADLVHQQREEFRASGDSVFRPFVLLNACHAGVPTATAELEYLGRAFVEHGAAGVLGPQIEIPQIFASEYAHAFLDRYLTGAQTAGEICRALVRHFLDELHNPLALAYLLFCGIDSLLEIRPCTSSPLTSTNEDGSVRPTVVVPSQATGSPSTSRSTSAPRTG
ncbi:CHAT domain-containing protein [Streptomyces sp. SID3212]|uniref:CHAT domain-containing protein n=1 Tax=Streptomyces sp. SID3212 TaxID=2690259 RepID=UPI00136B7F3B|nr:CHAT domain-containing protein [Streptomyces sp. SID3212]MYV53354.1 CHAT domain-containing protein [Streptomyces sp. SID3212]